MRVLLALTGAVLLAGCGDAEDFTIDVAMAPGNAKAELARLDGGLMLRALSLAPVQSDASVRDALSFVLPGDKADGKLQLSFEEVGTNGARIHVALDMPSGIREVQGKPMIVDEGKAEVALQIALTAWSAGIEKNGYASLDPLNEVLGALALVTHPEQLSRMLAAGDDPEAMQAILDPEVLAEMEAGSGDWGGGGSFDESTTDDGGGAFDEAGDDWGA